jgi:uncharacterized protein YecT (DUF1311 family)
MGDHKDPLRVFLCHSSDDKPLVRQLYERLKVSFVDPWLDERKIKGGQDWDFEIRRALRNSDVILICLSGKTAKKEGYIQKEIRQALHIAEEKPDGTIFIIPLRFEACDVPEQLQKWQRIDYFEVDGPKRLIESLVARAEHLNRYTSDDIEQLTDALALIAEVAEELGMSYASEAQRLRELDPRFAGNQMEMNFASYDAYERAETKLKQIITGLKEYYSPEEIERFDEVNAAWKTFQELNADFAASEFAGGSIVPLIYASALESVTIARVVELETDLRIKRKRVSFR